MTIPLGKPVRITDKDSTGHGREGVVVQIDEDGAYLVAVDERGAIRYWASSVEQIPAIGDTVEIVESGSPFQGTRGVLVAVGLVGVYSRGVYIPTVGIHWCSAVRLPVDHANTVEIRIAANDGR